MCQGGSLTEGNGTGGASISNEKFVQGQAHHEQQQARAQTTFDAIQGQLAKISSMLSRLAVSQVKQSTSAHTSKNEQSHHISVVPASPASSPLGVTATAPIAPKVFDTMPTPSSGCSKMFGKQSSAAESSSASSLSFPVGASSAVSRQTFASVSATSASTRQSATAYVAQQVFGGMPTAISWQCTDGTTPNYCAGHHNQIQNSCVSNLSEQNLEMPQSYGFDNLKRGSVFLADGSMYSYFALPEDYPLQRAVPEPVCVVDGSSTEFGDMFTSSPDQLTISFHKAPENASSAHVKVFSKATETEHAGACLNITSDMQNFILELQQQDDEKACNCPVLKASDSVVTSSSQLSSEHSMGELRLLWDPGAHTIPGSTTNRDIHCNFRLPTRLINHGILFLWDPGILSLRDMTLGTTVVPHQLHSRQTPCTLVILDQPVDMKHFLFQLLLQYNWWYHSPNAFLEVPFVLDCSYSEPIQQLVCYSCMFSSTEAIISAFCMSTAITLCMILFLSSGKIAKEERAEAATYQVSKIQLPMKQQSHVWDPGTMLLLYKSKWWLRYMEEKINWHKDTKFYQVTLWLIHFLPP